MKTLTYVAAIALLSAGAAFAQSSDMNSSSSMQKPPQVQSMPGQDQDKSGARPGQSGAAMNRDMDRSTDADSDRATNRNAARQPARDMAQSPAEHRHMASDRARAGGNDARENQETAQLNRRQLSGMGAGMTGGQTAETPFDRGSPQYPQAGGVNCTPDRPDCGTARQNPAIQSSPQQRIYNASPQ